MRMEDVDVPRSVPGMAHNILDALVRFGMVWDGPVMYQSRRTPAYRKVLGALLDSDRAFHCGCSRGELSGRVYPGTCRHGLPPGSTPRSVRVHCGGPVIQFRDGLLGDFIQRLETEVGDFVVRRADGLFAYQLAVVVDDAEQGISEIVRGSDLLDSTPRQIHLQRLLELPTPEYIHLPVATNKDDQKLSKQTGATPVDPATPVPILHRTLEFLGQGPPADLARTSLGEFWEWAIDNWDLVGVPRRMALRAPDH